jgi:hypothetical protein
MTAFIRKILLTILGLLGAVFAWGALEILLGFGESLGGYLILSIAEGILVGGFIGFFFGTSEGILLTEKGRAVKGGIFGFLIGVIGGVIAIVLAQLLLYILENANLFSRGITGSVVVPLSRTLGWVILGIIIGAVDGIRTRSLRRVGIGISGGIIGGLLGGLALEFLVGRLENSILARGAGLCVMGAFIGLFYSLFEYSRAFGILKVLTGHIKGKEYILSMKKTRIGSSRKAGLVLQNYTGVEKIHAEVVAGKDGVYINTGDGIVLVNDDRVDKQVELKYEDVIQLGSAKIYYLPR